LPQSVPGNGFRRFASRAQNGFVAVRKCFVIVSRATNVR
jgi:hypothetical protein